MSGNPPIEAQALAALLQRSFYLSYAPLVSPTMWPDPSQRAAWAAIAKYHDGAMGGDAHPDMTVADLTVLLPRDTAHEALVQLVRDAADQRQGPVAAQGITNFLRESATRELGALALEQAKWHGQGKHEKAQTYYDRMHKAAEALVKLEEDLELGEKVEPVSLRCTESFATLDVPRVPLGFSPSLDGAMGGGAPIGKLGAVMAPLKVGKTLSLCNLGAHAVRRGETVLHFTLEIDAETLKLNYFSMLTGIPLREMKDRAEEAIGLWDPKWGDILLYDYSGAHCNVGTIEGVVVGLGDRGDGGGIGGNNRNGGRAGVPSLLLLDYLSLCDIRGDDLFTALGREARRLRKLAVRSNLAVVFAHQANRKSLEEPYVTELRHSESSIQIPQIVDWMITLSQSPQEKLAKRMRAKLAASRLGFENTEVQLVCNYQCMQLWEMGCEHLGISRPKVVDMKPKTKLELVDGYS